MKTRFLLTSLALLSFLMNSMEQASGTYTYMRDGKVYETVTLGT